MSKLNASTKSKSNTSVVAVAAKNGYKVGVSANGNVQFVKEAKQKLYEVVAQTLFGKNGTLKSSNQLVSELKQALSEVVKTGDYDFVANLAVHARTELNIRTVPLVLVVEFAKAIQTLRAPYAEEIKKLRAGRSFADMTESEVARVSELMQAEHDVNYDNMRALVCDVIRRADQITDLYAYALDVFGSKNKIPLAVKRGVADAFNKFNEYNFAKYNRKTEVKFSDVLRIVHPVAKSQDQGVIFEKIMKDTLATPYTWETELSMNGQLPANERKTDAQLWTELVESGKLGYMALLRNLRNIAQAGVADSVIKNVCATISDPKQVQLSKQLPHDFREAYNVILPVNAKMATAVSKAIDHSVVNIPKIGDKIWLIIDYSGSMGREADQTSAFNQSMFLASALLKSQTDASNIAVTVFGSGAKTLLGVDTNNSIVALTDMLTRHRVGNIAGSTNFGAALRQIDSLDFIPDAVVVLTDGEVNGFPYQTLKKVPKQALKITVNMSAASTTPMTKADGWYALAGWSPVVFKWCEAMKNKEGAIEALSKPYVGAPKINRVDK